MRCGKKLFPKVKGGFYLNKKTKEFLLSVVSLIMCFSILFSTSASAQKGMVIDKLSSEEYNIVDSSVSSNSISPQAKWDIVKVKFPFLLVPIHKNPVYFKDILGWLWIGTKVIVLEYSGDFTKVEVLRTGDKGYIFSDFLDDDDKGELEIKTGPGRIWVGNETEITVKNSSSKEVEWSFSSENIVSYKKIPNGIKLKALKAGVVTVTATAGNLKDSYRIVCINRWEEKENSTTNKEIKVKETPLSSSNTVKILPAGSYIEALGDMGIGSGWLFVNTQDNERGFIELSDFPGIDYIMHQYHYYDKGFAVRFDSAGDKIYDYAEVLNDAMMRYFNLKVCPYVYPYTSVADECKISLYGSVAPYNLAVSCPRSGSHNADSCLEREVFFSDLVKKVGKGDYCFTKLGWTGHILLDNARSASASQSKTIVMTSLKSVDKYYINKSNEKILKEQSATLMHETVHQLGVRDHYCYNLDPMDPQPCINEGCYKCNRKDEEKEAVEPDCMMMFSKYPTETEDLLCDQCQAQILEFLAQE